MGAPQAGGGGGGGGLLSYFRVFLLDCFPDVTSSAEIITIFVVFSTLPAIKLRSNT